MKITFLLPSYPIKPMGGYKVVYEYANRLVEKNHIVNIIHPEKLPNWSSKKIINRFGKRIINVLYRIYRPKIYWHRINPKVNLINLKEPTLSEIPNSDIIFATSWQTAEIISDFPDSKGKKFYIIQDFDSYFGDQERLEKTWKLPFKKICVSRWLYNKVVNVTKRTDDITIIPNGIDHNIFKIINPIENRKKIILMMYYNAPYKAPNDAIEALNLTRKKNNEFKAIVFGSQYRSLKIPFWMKYVKSPNQEELVKLYNSAAIFLSSSIAEGFSLPPAEAMACGCAVVSTDNGGIREYAIDKLNCLLSPPKDIVSLSENLVKLLEDDNLRINIAKKGNETISRLSWEKSIELLEKFISNI